MFFPRPLMPCTCVAVVVIWCASGPAQVGNPLPEAPRPPTDAKSPANTQGPSTSLINAGSTISGTVLDNNGDVLQGARVQLSQDGAPGARREMKSGTTGEFA